MDSMPVGRRTRRRVLVAVLLLTVAAVGTVIALQLRTPVMSVASFDTTVLHRDTIQLSVSDSGVVASAESTHVYSTLPYSVTAVHVEVGQVVMQGDRLADLDPTALEQQILSREAALSQSDAVSDAAVQAARNRYEAAGTAVGNGTNPALVNAEAAVTNAHNAWLAAQKAFDDTAAALDAGQNAQLLSLKAATDNAAHSLESAQFAVDVAVSDLCSARRTEASAREDRDLAQAAVDSAGPAVTQAQLDAATAATAALDAASRAVELAEDAKERASLALDSARTIHQNAEAAYEAGVTSADNALADLRLAAQSSWDSYQNALTARDAAWASATTEITAARDALYSAEASAVNAVAVQDLINLDDNLDDTTIAAPTSGTVTAVYADVGANPAGLLFLIERTDRLVIDASVGEFDVTAVTPGIPVTIASDATRDAVYRGRVTAVSPASTRGPTGEALTNSEVQYATEIEVTSENTQLRIGMNVRLNYVLEEETGVLVVPYEAVFPNSDGSTAVLAAIPRAEGNFTVREIEVVTGLENDLSVAISGDGIDEGTIVLNNPAEQTPGAVIVIAD